jgi:hypothetical protein
MLYAKKESMYGEETESSSIKVSNITANAKLRCANTLLSMAKLRKHKML